MRGYLVWIGYLILFDFEKFNIVYVVGIKGKGSMCVFVDFILLKWY